MAQPTSRALKEWVFRGREDVGAGGDEEGTKEVRETKRRRFLIGLPGSVELAVGVIRPSTDQSGRREFPCMVLAHVPRRLYGRHYALLPMALGPLWDALDDAWDSLSNVATKTAFEEVLAETRVPAPAPPGEMKSSYAGLQQEATNGIFAQEEARLDTLLSNMPGFLGQLKKSASAEGVRLELPVSGTSVAACFDTAFWIDLLNRQFTWKRYEPNVFLDEPTSEKRSRVAMIFGILRPSDYPFVMGCEGPEADVSRPARPSDSQEQSPAPSDMQMTYAELLATRFEGRA